MSIKRLTILVIVLHFFIIIGAGHGIACIGLFEIIGLRNFYGIGGENFSFSLMADYEKSFGATALFTLTSHIIFILTIYIKNDKEKYWSKIIGIIFLWLSFFYLVHDLYSDDLALISFFCGLPFVICSILLLYRLKKERSSFLKNP